MTKLHLTADAIEFIDRLRICARRAGSVNKLAKNAGIPQSTIRPYFEGTDIPRRALISIAHAAGVSAEWLLTGKVGEPRKARAATN